MKRGVTTAIHRLTRCFATNIYSDIPRKYETTWKWVPHLALNFPTFHQNIAKRTVKSCGRSGKLLKMYFYLLYSDKEMFSVFVCFLAKCLHFASREELSEPSCLYLMVKYHPVVKPCLLCIPYINELCTVQFYVQQNCTFIELFTKEERLLGKW